MSLFGKIATFALKIGKKAAVAVVAKAVASDKVSLSKKDVTDAIQDAVEAEAMRQVGKRLGG